MQDYNNTSGEGGGGRQSYRASFDQSYIDPSASSSPPVAEGSSSSGGGQQRQAAFMRGGGEYAPKRGMSSVATPVHQGSGSSSLSNSSASMSGNSGSGSGSGWHSSSADAGAWNGQQQQRSGSGSGGTPRLDTQMGPGQGGVGGVSSPAKRSSAFGLPASAAQQYSNGRTNKMDLVSSPISSDGHSHSSRRVTMDLDNAAAAAGSGGGGNGGNGESAGRSVMAATSSYSALPRSAAAGQAITPALNGASGSSSSGGASNVGAGTTSSAGTGGAASASTGVVKERKRDQACAACGKQMTGQFVRALGTVYHLDCFRCRVSAGVSLPLPALRS